MRQKRQTKRTASAREAIERHWHLLRELPRYPSTVTAGQIASALAANNLEPSRRTIERDLIALSVMFPIVCDESKKPYRWSWQKDAPNFSVPGLTNSQALAMKLVEQHLTGLLPESIVQSMRPYFTFADKKLTSIGQHSRMPTWLKKVKVIHPAQSLRPPKISSDIQNTVYEGLLLERQLKLVYHKRGAASPTEYTVHPQGIVQRGPVTYLVCTLFDYQDPLLLALHRIRSVLMLELPSNIPKGFDLDTYVASGAVDFGSGETIRFEAAFTQESAAHLYETPLSLEQKICLLDAKRVKVSARVADTPQLRWWLLGFGDQVEVLKPKRLRESLTHSARGMVRLYK